MSALEVVRVADGHDVHVAAEVAGSAATNGAGGVARLATSTGYGGTVRAVPRSMRGMTTAEYAVGCVASVSFVGILISVLKNPEVQQLLLALIKWVLSLFWG